MEEAKVSKSEALLAVYRCVNGPVKAGPKWVTYSREQIEATLLVMKDLLVAEGYEFRKVD